MSTPAASSRFELRAELGQGGMGVVYRAYDHEQHREVALKTLRDAPTPDVLERFTRELEILKTLHHHPGIVPIFSFGTHEGKPFFTMPVLAGATLREIIDEQPHRLTPPRVVEIISYVCKGLQAAHDLKLIHRDVKPSNIFVLEDDTAVIIDFGIASLVDRARTRGLSGSPPYMSPEQLELRGATFKSDIFSLGVVCYEALSLRHPFPGPSESELQHQIRTDYPPSIAELNPAVSHLLSQVVNVAMAKSPRSRYESAREFMELLQAAVHNLPIERFSEGRIEPRLVKARRALDSSDYELAAEILEELRAEGWIHPQIGELREQAERAQSARRVANLLISARSREDHEEYDFALQKLDELLTLDPTHPEALEMQDRLRGRLKTQQHDQLIETAQQYTQKFQFARSRESLRALTEAGDSDALNMLHEIDQREREYEQRKAEKDRLRQNALQHWQNGDLSLAISQLEKAVSLDREAPDSATEASRLPSCQALYDQVRNEHEAILNALSEGRRLLSTGAYAEARAIIASYLEKYQEHPSFKALLFDIDERERQDIYTEMARIAVAVDQEPDLDRRVGIVEEALTRFPNEKHLLDLRTRESQRRDLVKSVVERARSYAERDQIAEALAQWQTLRTIYPRFTGLEHEIATLQRRLEQKAARENRARTHERIDQAMADGHFERALGWIAEALIESPGDAELLAMKRRAEAGQHQASEASQAFRDGLTHCNEGRYDTGFASLRRAMLLEPKNAHFRGKLVEVLIHRAEELMTDPDSAEPLLQEARELDPGNARLKAAWSLLADRRREAYVTFVLTGARVRHAGGDLAGARADVEKALQRHPDDPRLKQFHARILQDLEPREPTAVRERLDEALFLARSIRHAASREEAQSLLDRIEEIGREHPDNAQVRELLADAREAFRAFAPPLPPPAPPAPPPPVAQVFFVPEPEAPPPPIAAPPPPAPPPPAPSPVPVPSRDLIETPVPTPAPPPSKRPVPWLWLGLGAAAALPVAAVAYYFLLGPGSKPKSQPIQDPITSAAVPSIPTQTPAADNTPKLPPGSVRLVLAITAGDIFVDGTQRRPASTLGPIEEILPAGKHKLEVRQNNRSAFAMDFDLVAGGPPTATVTTDNDGAAAMSVFWNQGPTGVVLYPALAGLATANDNRRCPCTFNDLAPGTVRLRLTKMVPWYESYPVGDATPTLQVRAGDARFAPLELTSNAEGATVTIDGKAEGTIKGGVFRSRLLTVGKHTVLLAHPDHEPLAAPITAEVKRGATKPLDISLTAKPKFGRLRVSGTRGARLALGNQDLGAIPGEFDLPPGRHSLLVNLEGYEGRTHNVTVEGGKAQDVRIDLTPMQVVVTISAPPGIRVFHRAAAGGGDWAEHDRTKILSLSPALVDFECRADGFDTERHPGVVLVPGQPYVLRCGALSRKADAVKVVTLSNQQAFPNLAPRKKGGLEVNRGDSALAAPAAAGTLTFEVPRDARTTLRLSAGDNGIQFTYKDDKLLIKPNRQSEFPAGGGVACETPACAVRIVIAPSVYEVYVNGKQLHKATLNAPNAAALRLVLTKGSVVNSVAFTPAR